MPAPIAGNELVKLTTSIVSAHAANNPVPLGDVADLIQTVHSALIGLNQSGPEAQPQQEPAVNPKRSVTDDHIVCLDCGKKQKVLKRHIAIAYGMSPAGYRSKWNLPYNYPMVAPGYSKTRQDLAKQIGLGRKPADTKAAAKPRGKRSKSAA